MKKLTTRLLAAVLCIALSLPLMSCSESYPTGSAGFIGSPDVAGDFVSSLSYGLFNCDWFSENEKLLISATGSAEATSLPAEQTVDFMPEGIDFSIEYSAGAFALSLNADNAAQDISLDIYGSQNGLFCGSADLSYLYGNKNAFSELYAAYPGYIGLLSETAEEGDYKNSEYSIRLGSSDKAVGVITLSLGAEKTGSLISAVLSKLEGDETTRAAAVKLLDLFAVLTGTEEYDASRLTEFIGKCKTAATSSERSLVWDRYFYGGKLVGERASLTLGGVTYVFRFIYGEDDGKTDATLALTKTENGSTRELLTCAYTGSEDTDEGTESYNLRIITEDVVIVFANRVQNAWKSASRVLSLNVKRGADTVFSSDVTFKTSWKTDLTSTFTGSFSRGGESIDYKGEATFVSSEGSAKTAPEGEYTVYTPSQLGELFWEKYPKLYKLVTGRNK